MWEKIIKCISCINVPVCLLLLLSSFSATLCNPIDGSPLGSSVPGILQARTLEWVATSFSNAWKWKVKVKLLSCAWLLATPWTAAYQTPPSMGFSRQEYQIGVPLPSPYSILMHIYGIWKDGNDNPVCKTANETQMHRTVFWTLWEREGGWFGRMALKHVQYHIRNELPVQVQCRIQQAWGWCTGMTQRDGMGREVGTGFMMGNTCTPVADACWCMAKPIQYCKVK